MTSIIKIAPDGVMTFIYSDALASLCEQGEAVITRASHVEPTADGHGWQADMSPVDGPMLPVCKLRSEALAAEVTFLNQKLFGRTV